MTASENPAHPGSRCSGAASGGTGCTLPVPPDPAADETQPGSSPEKRRQILNGAREVFLAKGFDGASMGEIARAAEVSKGTLYLYFPSKEALFSAFVRLASEDVAERCFVLDPEADVGEVLTGVGYRYVAAMVRSEHIATVRMVLGIAEKLPEIGRAYLAAGQETAVERLSAWLNAKIDRGELAIDDVELAAWQFIIGCHALVVMPMLFGGAPEPAPERIERVVSHTVTTFLRTFAPRS
ncbi:TetR/AcrR family transcriptional regulator [Ancylobacter pratisalsi]|uniref:TetR/AcrR family transcriptional regulator n=1 Tax=Ancylobacter pratisalsi TaxID=1745854 RepID=A0A6P1YKJ9_9HYPH|nr:TetR/AcrR family transcriptional regulator [Ancylobacter pratisalsi]QIB33839.1 TetR/AcrR family transcriptional regulator [Ancylobacter pratisalsi]